jgi:hypothetical protein
MRKDTSGRTNSELIQAIRQKHKEATEPQHKDFYRRSLESARKARERGRGQQ